MPHGADDTVHTAMTGMLLASVGPGEPVPGPPVGDLFAGAVAMPQAAPRTFVTLALGGSLVPRPTFGWLIAVSLLAALAVTVGALGVSVRRLRTLTGPEGELDRLRQCVTRLERDRDALERMSVTDPLTGVWNYRYLHLTLDREVLRAGRFGHPLALLMLDLDSFAEVNSRHGHAGAGTVLREVAQRLATEIRSVDTLARYGGEEFVVLLPETDLSGAEQVAERLAYAVRRAVFGTAEDPVRLTLTAGLAVLPADGTHPATLLRAADRSLGRAKQRRSHQPG